MCFLIFAPNIHWKHYNHVQLLFKSANKSATVPCCWCALTVHPLPRVKKLGLTWQFSENNICQEWWINNNIFGLAVTMSWISWIIAADCYNLGSLALHTPSSVIMDQSVDGGVVSLLDCVLLSRIKARNSLWFYFWSHDTVFIYTAPATYPTINNGNVKK